MVRVTHNYSTFDNCTRNRMNIPWDVPKYVSDEVDEDGYNVEEFIEWEDLPEEKFQEYQSARVQKRNQIRTDMDTYVEELQKLIEGSSALSEPKPLVRQWECIEEFTRRIMLNSKTWYDHSEEVRGGFEVLQSRAWDAYDEGDKEAFAEAVSLLQTRYEELVNHCRKPLLDALEL